MLGYAYTWIKSKGTPDKIEEKLDRALASQTWLDIFSNYWLLNGISCRSDHFSIILKLNQDDCHRKAKMFCFENTWC